MATTSPLSNIKKEDFSILTDFINSSPSTVKQNFGNKTVDTIVIHWTAGNSLKQDISTIKTTGLGYHFIIDKDGKITQCKPISERTSHAGKSYGPQGLYVNQYSIGISFTNSVNGIESDEWTPKRLGAIKDLVLDLKKAIPTLKWITGHHWISPKRKIDPYTFPFNSFIMDTDINAAGFKLWKTGQNPFPTGLDDCTCIEKDSANRCKKSTGKCGEFTQEIKGKIYTYDYGPNGLTPAVNNLIDNDTAFISDFDGN